MLSDGLSIMNHVPALAPRWGMVGLHAPKRREDESLQQAVPRKAPVIVPPERGTVQGEHVIVLRGISPD